MVKQLKQRYSYKGKAYTLPELRKFVRFVGAGNIFDSICAATKVQFEMERYNIYSARMLVRHTADGKRYSYDFLGIKKEMSSPLES